MEEGLNVAEDASMTTERVRKHAHTHRHTHMQRFFQQTFHFLQRTEIKTQTGNKRSSVERK